MFEWGKTHQRLSSFGIKSANPSEQYVESGKSHRFSSSWVGNQPGCHPLFIRDGYPFQRKSTVFARCSHIFKIRDGHVQKRKNIYLMTSTYLYLYKYTCTYTYMINIDQVYIYISKVHQHSCSKIGDPSTIPWRANVRIAAKMF